MFRSSGFMSGVACPFYEHGLCDRPYCHYRHSRRERPAPRRRPRLNTKYTSYPSSGGDPAGTAASSSAAETAAEHSRGGVGEGGGAGEVAAGGKNDEDGVEVGRGNFAATIFSFYGAHKKSGSGEVADESGRGEEGEEVAGLEIGTGQLTDIQPGAVVELPSYAPEVCIETVVGFSEGEEVAATEEECSKTEVKEYPVVEIEPVTIEVAEDCVAMDTEPHPPTAERGSDDITEQDIFGSTDEDMESADVGVEEEAGGSEEGEGEGLEEGEGGSEKGEDQAHREVIKAAFQSALQDQVDTAAAQSLKRKSRDGGAEVPSTVQKKRRIALPKAKMYRQTSSSAVKAKPKTTSNFAASLDKEALYMGKKRTALVAKTAPQPFTAPRPRIPLTTNSKVPTKLRQKYLDSYIDELLKVTFDPQEAYGRAETEESQLFQRCSSRMIYCNLATQTLQRLRKEAKEFLVKQREISDARVHALREDGCGPGKTTPTTSQGAESAREASDSSSSELGVRLRDRPATHTPKQLGKNALKLNKKKKVVSRTSTDSASSPLSPQLMQKCNNLELRLTKCASVDGNGGAGNRRADHCRERTAKRRETSTPLDSEADEGLGTSLLYSSRSGGSSKRSKSEVAGKRELGGEKVKRAEDREISAVGDKVSVAQRDTNAEKRLDVGRGREQEYTDVQPHTTRQVSVSEGTACPQPTTADVGEHCAVAVDLTSELFGDSDSDCVMLPSPCSSGEEEIMNISFEAALKRVEPVKSRQNSQTGRREGKRVGTDGGLGKIQQRKVEVRGKMTKESTDKEMKAKVKDRGSKLKAKSAAVGREGGAGRGGEGGKVSVVARPRSRVGKTEEEVWEEKEREEVEQRRAVRVTSSKVGKRRPRMLSTSATREKIRRASLSELEKEESSSQSSLSQKGSVSKATRPQRRVSKEESRPECRDSGSDVSPANNPDDLSFRPNSQSLVNLSAVAKSNRPTPSSLPRPPAASPSGSSTRGQRSQKAPPTSASTPVPRPTYTIFKKKEVTFTDSVFYSMMWSYLLTQQQLEDNGYPQPTQREGVASINWGGEAPPDIQPVGSNAMRHRCRRCGKPFIIYQDGQYQTVEDCIYHYGRLIKIREYGEGVVSEYSCCNERRDSGGCQVAKMHVTAGARPSEESGYVQTTTAPSTPTSPTAVVYALDCEMCYTTAGLELTRVSVVNMSLKPIYESLVRPPHPIVDYNTRFSGLSAEDFVSVDTSLAQVQQQLLALVASDTILLGHSLESDLRALKIIHSSVVDTAVVFPHRKGPPLKRALRTLMKEFMQKFIQDNVDGGHDSLEDARSCMELMLWRVKGDLQKTTRRGN